MALLTNPQRYDQAVRLALEVLQTEQDSEPADPRHDHEITLGSDVWRRMVALARQAVSGKRGRRSPGICRVCGCTWLWACRGGCSWADETMTLCSNCVDKEKPR